MTSTVGNKDQPCNTCAQEGEVGVVVNFPRDNSNTVNQISKDCGDIDAVSSSGCNHHHSGPKVISPSGGDESKSLVTPPVCPIHNNKNEKVFTTTDELAKG